MKVLTKLTEKAKTTVVEQMLHEIEDVKSGEVQAGSRSGSYRRNGKRCG